MNAEQLSLLAEAMERGARSSFYGPRLARCTAPEPAARLAQLQPCTREDWIDDQIRNPPHGGRLGTDSHAVRAGKSGSRADLFVHTWTANDLASERAAGVRTLTRLGVTPGQRIANALPGALTVGGSLLLGDVVQELGALDIPLGAVTNEASATQAWRLIDRVQPHVLVLDEHSAAPLFAHAPPTERAWWKTILWARRPESGDELAIPDRVGFNGRQGRFLTIAEVSAFVASQQEGAAYVADEGIVLECLDNNASAAIQGQLVISNLGAETSCLRFATGIRVSGTDDGQAILGDSFDPSATV